MEPPTPSFKVHGERCPQKDFTTHPLLTMLCPPPADVGESMYPRRLAVARREPGDYSSPTPPLFSNQLLLQDQKAQGGSRILLPLLPDQGLNLFQGQVVEAHQILPQVGAGLGLDVGDFTFVEVNSARKLGAT